MITGPLEVATTTYEIISSAQCLLSFLRINQNLQDILDPHFSIPKDAVVQFIYAENDFISVLYKDRVYVISRYMK